MKILKKPRLAPFAVETCPVWDKDLFRLMFQAGAVLPRPLEGAAGGPWFLRTSASGGDAKATFYFHDEVLFRRFVAAMDPSPEELQG